MLFFLTRAGCYFSIEMRNLAAIAMILLMAPACSSKGEKNKSGLSNQAGARPVPGKFSYGNIVIEVKELKTCSYPEKEPLFEKKKNKKLVVVQVTVTNTGTSKKEDITPYGAIITDEKGNSYETSPGVVGMAQSSGCIMGDDLADYNCIWNGKIAAGETKTAFVLGFEIPENAIPEKIGWNKNRAGANQYILLNQTTYTVNH